MLNQTLGWIANVFFVYGVWVIGNKNVKGFYANALANLFYARQSINMNNDPLFWLSILLIIINLKGIYQWQFKDRKDKLDSKLDAGQKYNSAIMDYVDRDIR